MVKKIFLTGASGFIGRSVIKRLKANHQLTLLLLPDDSVSGLGDLNIVRGDITRPRSLSGLMKGHDTVIHLAGAVGYQSWRNCLSLNVDGTRNILRQAVKAGVIRFIHMSSVAVYGRIPDIRVDEGYPYKKIQDPYGDTKIAAELLAWKYAEKHRIDLTVLRPTTVYGEGDNKFLPPLVQDLHTGNFRMIGDINHSVDLVHVADVAESVWLALHSHESVGQAFNIANDRNPAWNKFLETVCSELGIPFPDRSLSYKQAYRMAGLMEFLSIFSGRPPRLNRYTVRLAGRQYGYSIEKARRQLGYEPSMDILEGIRPCIRSFIS